MRAFGVVFATGLLLVVPAMADDLWRVRPNEVYGPATYCAWNRTGLPAAQQAICANRDAAISARKPTPSIKAFLEAAAPAQRNMTLASWAVMCGFRSERWQYPITVSYQEFMRETANRFRIGSDGLNAADMQSKRIDAELRSKVSCKTLAQGEVMAALDSIRNQVTGGYH